MNSRSTIVSRAINNHTDFLPQSLLILNPRNLEEFENWWQVLDSNMDLQFSEVIVFLSPRVDIMEHQNVWRDSQFDKVFVPYNGECKSQHSKESCMKH